MKNIETISNTSLQRFQLDFEFKALFLLVVLNFFSGPVSAHQGEPPQMLKTPFSKTSAVDELVLTPIDANQLRAASERKRNSNSIETKTIEFAITEDVVVTPATHGSWVAVNGGDIWRLRVIAPGATDLNFGFTQYWMPKGATLHVYDPESANFQGPYTAEHNYDHGQLWTPLTPSSEAIIEVFVPTGFIDQVKLTLTTVGKGYRDIFKVGLSSITKQGSCNIDVVCSEADAWRDEIRSVARISIGGRGFCTGTLVNNIAQDFKAFFLTADHCGVSSANAASVVAFWNFESPSCGQLSGGNLNDNQSGASFRANDAGNDMSLLELSALPDTSYNVHYAGWDARSSLNPLGSVGIHHPRGNEKAIAFNDDALTSRFSCIGPSNPDTHWNVDNWEQGTTEPGSSGSALFDPASKRLIGYLSGGAASCTNTGGLDCYGKFSAGWPLGLSTWLDPSSTGTTFLDGANPGMVIVPEDSATEILDFLPAFIKAATNK
jgi:hypothetical protein